jgi:ribulose-5-phosphate 4-epimerase/fuculose-1-phosphate aldolase
VAFSSLGKPLVAVSNAAGYFAEGRLPIFSETTDLIVNQERGKAVARCLGGHAALLLRNHGIVATGGSIAEAVWCAIKLEKACQAQLLAEAAGGPKLVADGKDLDKKRARANRPDLHNNTFSYLVRKWRCTCCGEIVPAPHVTTFENKDGT